MSSPIDCSSPNASPDALSSSSSTRSDGQSSATLANDPIIPSDSEVFYAGVHAPGGDDAASLGDDGLGDHAFARRDHEPQRGISIMAWGLMFLVLVLLSALGAPGDTLTNTPPGCRAPARNWMAFKPQPILDFITINMTRELMGVVETYEPFLGAKVALLPLNTQPNAHANGPIGASRDFFDKTGHAVTVLCDSIKQSRAGAVDESLLDHLGRRHEEVTDKLCRPLLDLVSSTSDTYLEVAHALAGPYLEAMWMHQVAAHLSIMAEQVLLVHHAADPARMGGPGDMLGEADYVEANNSAAGVFQALIGPRGMWPRFNSRFIGVLWELRSNCAALGEAIAALAPVTHSFIVGMSASPASPALFPVSPGSQDRVGGDALLLQAHVIDNWLHLESALPVLDTLAAAAEEGISALVMANHRLQVLYDLLGSLRASCWVRSEAGAGSGVAVHVVLAEPRSLRDAVIRVSEWLEKRAMGS